MFKKNKSKNKDGFFSKYKFWQNNNNKSGIKVSEIKIDKSKSNKITKTFFWFMCLLTIALWIFAILSLTPIILVSDNIEFSLINKIFLYGVIILEFVAPFILFWFIWDTAALLISTKFKNFGLTELKKLYHYFAFLTLTFALPLGSIINVVDVMNKVMTTSNWMSAIRIIYIMFIVIAIASFILVFSCFKWLIKNSNVSRKAIFAGSFDPMHEGHMSIIMKAMKMFDSIIVVVSNNSLKSSSSLDQRFDNAKNLLIKYKKVKVVKLPAGLLADFAKEKEVSFLIRSARNEDDFKYELEMANSNRNRNEELETILIMPHEKLVDTHSYKIRENKGDIQKTKDEDNKNNKNPEQDNPLMHKPNEQLVDAEDAENNWFGSDISSNLKKD